APFARFLASMLTPGIAPPEVSTTVPEIDEDVVPPCAKAGAAAANTTKVAASTTNTRRRTMFVFSSPRSSIGAICWHEGTNRSPGDTNNCCAADCVWERTVRQGEEMKEQLFWY